MQLEAPDEVNRLLLGFLPHRVALPGAKRPSSSALQSKDYLKEPRTNPGFSMPLGFREARLSETG
jgi:hypothetical protein